MHSYDSALVSTKMLAYMFKKSYGLCVVIPYAIAAPYLWK